MPFPPPCEQPLWLHQIYGAWLAAGCEGAPRPDGGYTFLCPACAAALGAAEGLLLCECGWSAEGGLGVLAAAGKAERDRQRVASDAGLEARPLADLPESDPPGAELIKDRFLCRAGGALLVAPSGIGKSTLGMQLAMAWSVGVPLFGLRPAGELESLIIQAENDDGDLREMRNGALAGLRLFGERAALAAQRVRIFTSNSQSGQAFLDLLGRLLEKYRPALVWIDPAFAFQGGSASEQRDVSWFLRAGLNPLLHKYQCAAIIIHHTNKPPRGKEKGDWQAGDYAYLGSGSAEWTNWARAVLAFNRWAATTSSSFTPPNAAPGSNGRTPKASPPANASSRTPGRLGCSIGGKRMRRIQPPFHASQEDRRNPIVPRS